MFSVTLALTISKSFWGKVTSATQTTQIDGGHRARKRTKTFSLAWPPILQNPTDLTPNEDMVSQRQAGPRGAELATGGRNTNTLRGPTLTDPNPHGWSSHPSYMLRCHQLTTLTQGSRNKQTCLRKRRGAWRTGLLILRVSSTGGPSSSSMERIIRVEARRSRGPGKSHIPK